MKKNGVLVSAVVAVLTIFALGMFFYQNKKGEERTEAATQNSTSLVQFHSPSMGARDAKVTIVEFFDPSCEACRAYYPLVKSILSENTGKVRLVLRYAAFHKDSDVVVKILEASKVQGLFWQTLEAALQSQPVWAEHGSPQVERIWEFLQPVGLDIEKAKRDMDNAGIAAVLKQDMSDVMALKVEKTPTFYVNGKLLLDMSESGFRALIQQEIKASYP
jgi:protein-disulfide isomerase